MTPREVKGIGAATGTILLTPNELRVAEDRRDCYWLYVVADCHAYRRLDPIADPARLAWHEVTKLSHYYLSVDAAKEPTALHDERGAYDAGQPS